MSKLYPLQGQLISGSELDRWLIDAVGGTRQEALLCSAYIRSHVLMRLFKVRAPGVPLKASVLVRWQVQDLLSGASDFDLFPMCRELGVDLYLKLDFHGKVYAVPPLGISVGSTNATGNGFGLGPNANSEVNTLVSCTDENLRIVKGLFTGATRVTEALFERMCFDVEAMRSTKDLIPQWSSVVMSLLSANAPPTTLLVDECLLTDAGWWVHGPRLARDLAAEHDLQLLGLSSTDPIDGELEAALRRTKCVRWLAEELRAAPDREMYFGALTAALHDALLDDPGPRRSEVKTLLQNLLSWIQLARLPELSIDRPNHSQRVRLRTGDL